MTAVVPFLRLISDQAKPGLVDERGGLQSVALHLIRHLLRGQTSQFLVNQREQFIRSPAVAVVDGVEDACDFAHGPHRKASFSDVESNSGPSLLRKMVSGERHEFLDPRNSR